MTSLEALERLGAEKLARGELIRNDNKVENYIQSIKQDLEVLEIIKANKNIIFSKNPNYENMSADDFFKLSRWLEG